MVSTIPPAMASGRTEGQHALARGTRLHEFEIEEERGEGGFSIVYLAFDHSLHRRVALKEYIPGALAHREGTRSIVPHSERQRATFEAGLRSFVNEARLLAQFDHPALVKVYRFWEDNGTAYIAMANYEGPTLREKLALGWRPNADELMALALPLLDAVELLHRRQCFHRDIAPDNIIVQPDGRPVLLDFGAARRIIGEMTQALTVVLKAGYAPIEQYSGDGTLMQGAWTDVYALSALFYALITGKSPTPSVGRTLEDRVERLASNAPAGFHGQFLSGIDAGLRLRPQDRPQSIAEFRTALGIVQAVAPLGSLRPAAALPAPPDGDDKTVLVGRSARSSPRKRNLAIVAGLLVLVIAGAALIATSMQHPSSPKAQSASAKSQAQIAKLTPPPPAAPAESRPAPTASAMKVEPAPTVSATKVEPAPTVSAPTAASSTNVKPAPVARVSPQAVAPASPPGPPMTSAPTVSARATPKPATVVEGNAPIEAMASLRRSAEQGDVKAQLALADRYENGIGVGKDLSAALKWYELAARQGDNTARERVGRLTYQPKPPPPVTAVVSPKNEQSAPSPAPVFTPAPAPAKSQEAFVFPTEPATVPKPIVPTTPAEQFERGRDYEIGRNNFRVDLAEAARWYRLAAERGDAGAQNFIGYAYKEGRGVAVDYAEARKWLERSAAQGNPLAENNLGNMYRFGQGVPRNDVLAAGKYRSAAEKGNAGGQNNLGWMYENGYGVFRSYEQAETWYRKAAEAGNAQAMFNLGRLYASGQGVTRNPGEATKWLRRAAEKGNKDATAKLAEFEASGKK